MEDISETKLSQIFSLKNFQSALTWWIVVNSGIIAYYSHDFSFLLDPRFLFAEFLIFGLVMIGLNDIIFLYLSKKYKIKAIIMVLGVATVLHFQFEHSFKFFFFGDEV